MNHSFNPNLIYHCGILFAKKYISKNTELTVDYRYFLANNELSQFIDEETNKTVKGFKPDESLVSSAKEIINLFS